MIHGTPEALLDAFVKQGVHATSCLLSSALSDFVKCCSGTAVVVRICCRSEQTLDVGGKVDGQEFAKLLEGRMVPQAHAFPNKVVRAERQVRLIGALSHMPI